MIKTGLHPLPAKILRWFLNYPGRAPLAGFLVLIGIGTLLLMLPVAAEGERIGFVDALFTATSASCVTGLIVMDTGGALSLFGELVVLVLIQIGALGIMSTSTLLLAVARRRPTFIHRQVIVDTFGRAPNHIPLMLIRYVILFTFSIELIGAVFFFIGFLPGHSILRAAYLAVFHSVSAFCNAGFSLFPDSLTGYRDNWLINLNAIFLIITGGIGFLVMAELKERLPYNRQTWTRLSLHSKLALSSTILLLAGSTLIILFLEWQNSLAPLSIPERFLTAFFQAVTTRTAGFNTVAFERLTNQTLFFIIVLMFIGACPGSCAGGVKTTTVSSLMLLGFSRFRGHTHPRIFHRSIPMSNVWKAVNVLMISTLVVVLALMLILETELGHLPHMEQRGRFMAYFFEVVSAFGTVGLSVGVTGGLTTLGKLLITVLMFTGRLGPLVIGISISRQRRVRYYYAEESIMIG